MAGNCECISSVIRKRVIVAGKRLPNGSSQDVPDPLLGMHCV